MTDNRCEGRIDQNCAQTFSLPDFGLFFYKASLEFHFFSIALDFQRNGVPLAANDAPLDARAHAGPFGDGFAIDFHQAITGLQESASRRFLLDVTDDGRLFRLPLGTSDA